MSWYNPLSWGQGQKVDLNPNLGRLPGAGDLRGQMQAGLDAVRGRQAPQAGNTMVGNVRTGQASQLDPRMQAQFRAQQMQLADRLTGIASGQQQGAGELAAQRQGNNAIAQQQAMARMGRGGNAALAARGAASNAANIGLNTAGLSQQAALQDQSAANAQLGGVISQGREQDIGMAGQNANLQQNMKLANLSAQNQQIFQQAGLNQATSLANMQSKLATMGMNDQAQQAYLAQLFGVSAAEMQGMIAAEGIKVGNYDPGWGREFVGAALQTGGTYAANAATASDRTLKKDVRSVSRHIDKMLDGMKSYTARYKDEGAYGEGRRAMIMAQDLEKSEAGRRIVRDTPNGKMLDNGAAISAALASAARLNERLRKLEKAKK